jgi:hypothetical protein
MLDSPMKKAIVIFILFILGFLFFLTAWHVPIESLGEILSTHQH